MAWENNDSSYAGLMSFIRENADCAAMWSPESNEQFLGSAYPVEMDVRQERDGNATVFHRTLHTPKGDLTSVHKIYDDVRTTWIVEHWCKSTDDVDKALSIPYEPLAYDSSDRPRIDEELGDRGVVMDSPADPLWMAADLMEFGDYTVWALANTEHFARTVEIMRERCLENLKRSLGSTVSDIYRICGPEYATPPYLPPEFFARFVTPCVKDMVDLIHDKGAIARFHSHGKINQVLDMIVETGADALDPCEPPPDGDIELADVKRRVGGRMCLCGNLELKLIEHGSHEEIRKAVIDAMTAAKPGGGFIIMPTASPINTPLAAKTEENYRVWIQTALEFGAY
jgi:hypothetical protein